jgi:tRNA 2-thiouridine synthesizing protein A
MDKNYQMETLDEEMDSQDQINIATLLHDLGVITDRRCSGCGAVLCGHEALMSLTMGFKDAPRCWPCLANGMAQDPETLRDHLLTHIESRACFHEGWLWANREEGFEPGKLPSCLWPTLHTSALGQMTRLSVAPGTPIFDVDSNHDAEWDAGAMACGDLVLELRVRLQSIKPGEVLKVVARDVGAKNDLPAWCRMTGHTLVASPHPVYLIRRKTDLNA